MRRLLVALAPLALCTASAGGSGIQLLNTEVLGKPTSEPVKLLMDKIPGDGEPFVIWTDVECGEYYAASVFYRKPVLFEQVRASLNRRFGAFEVASPSSKKVPFSKTMALWRVTDPAIVSPERPALSIQLANDEDDSVRVTYIQKRRNPCPAL